MGYTHYWNKNQAIPSETWDLILEKAKAVCALEIPQIAGPFGTGEPVFAQEKICFNGFQDDSYETFILTPEVGSDLCKTAHRPYDSVVTAILILASHYAPSAITCGSDGNEKDWEAGLKLAQKVEPAVRSVVLD